MRYAETMQNIRYNIILRPESEGGFTVIVPALPGCVTYGKNLREARMMAQDAISAYLASLQKHGEPIPSDNESVIASVELPQKQRKGSLTYA